MYCITYTRRLCATHPTGARVQRAVLDACKSTDASGAGAALVGGANDGEEAQLILQLRAALFSRVPRGYVKPFLRVRYTRYFTGVCIKQRGGRGMFATHTLRTSWTCMAYLREGSGLPRLSGWLLQKKVQPHTDQTHHPL